MKILRGCIYGILGPSGCGKSTLVKAMARILVPTRGSVQVLGQQMPQLKVMNQIGYMAQSDGLYQNLNGKENMDFFGYLYELRGKALRVSMQEALTLVNLTEHQFYLVRDYSGVTLALLLMVPILLLTLIYLLLDTSSTQQAVALVNGPLQYEQQLEERNVQVIRCTEEVTLIYYIADSLRQVMLKGAGLEEVADHLLALLGFSLLFLFFNIRLLKNQRRV